MGNSALGEAGALMNHECTKFPELGHGEDPGHELGQTLRHRHHAGPPVPEQHGKAAVMGSDRHVPGCILFSPHLYGPWLACSRPSTARLCRTRPFQTTVNRHHGATKPGVRRAHVRIQGHSRGATPSLVRSPRCATHRVLATGGWHELRGRRHPRPTPEARDGPPGSTRRAAPSALRGLRARIFGRLWRLQLSSGWGSEATP
jgi:hypothetical protein